MLCKTVSRRLGRLLSASWTLAKQQHVVMGSASPILVWDTPTPVNALNTSIAPTQKSSMCTVPNIGIRDFATSFELDRGVKQGIEDDAYQRLSQLSEEQEQHLKLCKMEYDVAFSLGQMVPKTMTDSMLLKLLSATSMSARKRLFKYFMTIESKQVKKAKKRLEHQEYQKSVAEFMATRGDEYFNRIFLKHHNTVMNKSYTHNVANAWMWGQPLVFDMGFDQLMTEREMNNLIKQISYLCGINKRNPDAFNLHFCNCKQDTKQTKLLQQQLYFPTIEDSYYTITKQSYLDIFPHQDLVYLTPDAHQTLDKFDPEAVYIIGGIVDLGPNEKATLARAKYEGIRMARLPLDRYVQFQTGKKTLCLDQMLAILSDLKQTNDWTKALRHLPVRKLALHSRRQLHGDTDPVAQASYGITK